MSGGYEDAEYLVNGVAKTYSGPATGPAQETGVEHRFATRLLTRYPLDPDRFSGRVFLEPFNTSRNGIDSDVVWDQVATLLQSNGDAWVGVTVRSSAGDALRACDPERYAELDLAINDVEWDILRQVGYSSEAKRGCSVDRRTCCSSALHGRLFAECGRYCDLRHGASWPEPNW